METSVMTAPRIVILTSGAINGRRVSLGLSRLGIQHDVVTICYDPPKRRHSPNLAAHLWRLLLARVKSLHVLRRYAQRHLPRYPSPEQYAGFCNGRRCLRLLGRLAPDYILMMGGGILGGDVIRTARKGVINSHPGLLPWIRGLDVIENAILRRTPVGVTCHYIDTGIDTGPIISRHLLPINSSDTLSDLRERANLLECSAMVAAAARLARGDSLTGMPQSSRFKYCRRLSADEMAEVHRLMNAGVHLQAPAEWAGVLAAESLRPGEEVLGQFAAVIAT